MASLRVQARRNARTTYRPQFRELERLRKEAKETLRMGTRGEKQAARGIIRTAEQAIRGVRKDYRQAGAESRMANRLGGAITDDTLSQANVLSRRQTRRGIAQAVAAEVGDLRGRMQQAAEGAAYSRRALRGQYQSELGGIQEARGELARERGQFETSELGRLRGERADQRMAQRRLGLEERRVAQADERIGLERQRVRISRRNARRGAKKERRAETVHSQNIKAKIIDARAMYERQMMKDVPLRKIARSGRRSNVPEYVLNAASSLATKGYIPPNGVRELRQLGVRVPSSWQQPGGGGGSAPGGKSGLVRRSIRQAFG